MFGEVYVKDMKNRIIHLSLRLDSKGWTQYRCVYEVVRETKNLFIRGREIEGYNPDYLMVNFPKSALMIMVDDHIPYRSFRISKLITCLPDQELNANKMLTAAIIKDAERIRSEVLEMFKHLPD